MLTLKYLPITSFNENIAYLHKDCITYRVDDLNQLTKIEIHGGVKTVYAFLQIVDDAKLVKPNEIALKHYLSRFYLEDCRYDLAMDQLFEILDIDSDNLDAYWDLGNIQFEMGDYDSAVANYETVLDKINDNAVLYYQTAIAYEANDNLDKAISNHLKALSCNENFHPSYKKLGILFMARNDIEGAIEYFEDYLKFDLPEDEKKNIEDTLNRIRQ